MKSSRLRFVWAAATLVFGGLLALAWWTRETEVRRAHSDFQWFSTLGFPEVKGLPYVRVATGKWSQSGNDPPENHYLTGFLLESNAASFKVYTLDLPSRTFTNTPSATAEYQRVGFEILDLRREAELRLQKLLQPPSEDDAWRYFRGPVPEQTEVFVLAWACWREGLESQALGLYREAGNLPRPYDPPARKLPLRQRLFAFAQSLKSRFESMSSGERPMRESLEKSISHWLMWSAFESFEDPSVSRPELLQRFEAVVQNYPHSEHKELARKTAEVLQRMIVEDRAHATQSSKDSASLPKEKQIQELIFQLRDQSRYQFDWGDNTNTPAHTLANLGYAAVPQLIAALDSDALSRITHDGEMGLGDYDFRLTDPVSTVGDCAGDILERITGRSLFQARYNSGSRSTNGEPSATRKAADVWWTEFQKKGERQMLIEGVTAGGEDAPSQAALLRDHFPDIASPILIQGAQTETNSRIRVELIDELSEITNHATIAFFREEMTNGLTLESKVAAAQALLKHDEYAAVSAMIQEWQSLDTANPTQDDDHGEDRIIEFLARSDSAMAISTLASNLAQRPVTTILKVVEALGDSGNWVSEENTNTPPSGAMEAAERVLVAAIDDTEERSGMGMSRGSKYLSDPRICDVACWLLSERWPDRYSFDVSKSLKSRDRQRVECVNSWRKTHNLALLSLPQNQSPRVGRNESTKVTAIEWESNSVPPAKDFAATVTRLNGGPLNVKDLVALLTHFAAHPETNAAGLHVQAFKDEDLTGVRLLVRLIPGISPVQNQNWSVNERVVLGHKGLHDRTGGWGGDEEAWEDFADAAKQAIAGPPETPFEISARIEVAR